MDYSEKPPITSEMQTPDAVHGGASQHSSISHDAEKVTSDYALEKTETSGYASGARLFILCVAVCLAVFLMALDMTIVATAIPRITDEFNSLDQVGWYGSAFFLTLAAFQTTFGKGYKYFDLKLVFLLAIAVFEIGSLICGVAPNSTAFIVGRAIAGVGAAGIAAGAYSIIAFSVTPLLVPAYTGLLGATYSVASVVGPLLGGVFTQDVSWRWCFYVNLPIGGVSAAIIILWFSTPKNAKPVSASWKEKLLQMDLPGTFLLMACLVCLILALQWGGTTKPWNSGSVIGTLVASGVILIIFIINEYIMDERALFVRRLVKQKTNWLMCLYIVFISGSFFILLYYLPIYFQSILATTASESGLRNLPLILGCGLFAIVSGVTITASGHYVPLMIVGAVFQLIGAALIFTLNIGSSSGAWIGYQAIGGIGIGLSLQIPVIVAQGTSASADVSSVTALILFFQTISGAIFISVGQSLFTNRLLQTVEGVSPQLVVVTGATELRKVFTPAQLPGILRAYMTGLKDAFILSIALTAIAVAVSVLTLTIDHRILRQKKVEENVPAVAA